MTGRVTARLRATRIHASTVKPWPDTVAVEEPLEIRVDRRPLAVTMRTPGNDIDLTLGFLFTEGLITDRLDVATIRYCDSFDDRGRNTYNVLDVTLTSGITMPDTGIERNFYTTSSCGVCGKASLDAIRQRTLHPPAHDSCRVTSDVLAGLPERMRTAQRAFARTGGLHAAGLFTAAGDLLTLREDIGRHNAVDKVIGWATKNRTLPLHSTVLLVSGRASFELTQKAVMAGIPVLAAVSAPSSPAVELARESGITLVGFLRGSTMNVYTCPERITHTYIPTGVGTMTNSNARE